MQLLLGHTKLESTARYLGIEVDDALEFVEQTGVEGELAGKRSLAGHMGLAVLLSSDYRFMLH